MKASDIRATFLKFFESKGHTIVASSPVVPGDDPTLLFTNAGMNQFKDVFLGFDKRPYNRATTAQKCIRAGGKHNDLENVGYTARHHTFFEMLGNFSFGDYFKKDAISYAWELLTEHFKLPKDKLWVTVYSEDDEAYEIWNKVVGVPAERIVRIGDNKGGRYMSDNFWMMGDTGPCGPCTEIFYDHGPEIAGGPPGSPDEDGDRYIEIWNNVFMQFNRTEDGVMHPLPKPSVDTGMGLERVTAVLQHVHSNYEIDLFVALLAAAKQAVDAAGAGDCDKDSPSLKVIADHIRACSFTVADGVIPGNEGRGYVLRRIARRGIRHGYKLGARKPFFHTLVAALTEQMGEAYPELRQQQARITEVLKQEEERFFQTIANGMEILDGALAKLQAQGGGALDGELAFKLHDTYGFPLDLTADVCRERGLSVDNAGFDAAMNRQREQARAAGKFKMQAGLEYSGTPTTFHGYEELSHDGAKVTAVYVDGTPVASARAGDDAVIVLDHTPFYAESGGQHGDTGELRNATSRVLVEDTLKVQADVYGHHGRIVEGEIKVGDVLAARVDAERRAKTIRNHSATHLMHKALREVLGGHVQQKGSLVTADRTRFDFAHNAPLTAEQIAQVEAIVNAEILANADTQARSMGIEEAQKLGAMMLFGEKYGDTVRVLDIGSSRELCGGTHVRRTGDIGLFKIVAESGVAAGIRRVEAVTGDNALAYLQGLEHTVDHLAATLKVTPTEVGTRVNAVLDQVRSLEKELAALKGKLASAQGDELMSQAVDINGLKVLAARLEGADAKTLRETMDKLKDKLKTAAIVLAAVDGDKVQLAAGVTADSVGKLKAGELVNFVAQQVGGKGGGKPDMAMAGGTDASKLAGALQSVRGWVAERV
ncbi:alanine--tRNA ligase [Aquincola tertiaricarbonis]|uniref:Alanine--tRNA ligase n=1 Tax=Aquincola tertiaricarbonis TaxID=391953 RepID=A0ABY4SIC2_AQUTE|nr:alanine--tRNA ligase [Aquincola tertiaricarbonis]URI11075.1 alanine--tRNA ligase [Aquincola tertiaricarbonis]